MVSLKNFDLWTDVLAALVDGYVSDKILKSDMKPVVKVVAAVPWIIQGTVNAVNFVNKITNGDYETEETPKPEEET